MSTLLLDRVSPAVAPATVDPILLHAFARRGRPLSVSDLLRAMSGTGARLSDVMDLLAAALHEGLLGRHGHRADADGALVGPLLYDLTDDGWAVVEADRLAV
ncbi:MAG: hypothetical protein ACJ762_05940 [Solirubrobacteraceae bacterium]